QKLAPIPQHFDFMAQIAQGRRDRLDRLRTIELFLQVVGKWAVGLLADAVHLQIVSDADPHASSPCTGTNTSLPRTSSSLGCQEWWSGKSWRTCKLRRAMRSLCSGMRTVLPPFMRALTPRVRSGCT